MARQSDGLVLALDGREVVVTHPDKPYFTSEVKLSKLDIVRYFLSVAPGALAGIRDRPVVLKRFVDGAEGEPFYQKRAPAKRPDWLRTVTLAFPSGRTAEEVVVDDAAGLAWIVNLGCIELHPHPVRSGDLDHPDELRIDLDPTPGVAWATIRRVALEVRALLEELGLTRLAEDQRLARHACQCPHPSALDVHRGPAGRARPVAGDRAARCRRWPPPNGGRRNGAACSSTTTRTPRTAPPARPIRFGRCRMPGFRRRSSWAEVPDCEPSDFTVLTMPERFAAIGDPHRGMDAAAGSLEALLELAARDEAAGLGDAPWPPQYRKMAGEPKRVAPSRAKRPGKAPRVSMPLIVIAKSPDREAALAGLERWKQRHPEAASHLAIDDVLVDTMRGRSSTWTRIRLNLRNVPP